MKIICDYREHSIYDCLVKKIEKRKNYENISVEKTNLNIGDFVIGRYIIERKTLSDLASSILDGRYKEQSSRLDAYIQEHAEEQPVVMYFIEGSFDLFTDGYNMNKDKLISACISLMCSKNYKVFLTRHVNEHVISFKNLFQTGNTTSASGGGASRLYVIICQRTNLRRVIR